MKRVVSLIASSTEIVCALGCEDWLVGRSHECDFPESVKRLPVCTEPKFAVAGSSAEIDKRVRDLARDALSVYQVHEHMLAELAPDVIVTQSQCEVCAVSLKDVEAAVCKLGASLQATKIVSLLPNAIADVWQDIAHVAETLGVPERGAALVSALQARIDTIARRTDSFETSMRPKVACIEWIEPLMAAGNWVPELVVRAGGVNLFGEAGKHSPWMTWDELVAKNPDVIVVLPCGFDIPRTMQEMHLVAAKPGFSELSAAKNRRVVVADGNQYFNRPGPRLVESLEILAEIMWPGRFAFGHEGRGWVRFEGGA
jgi:iron complex transport system substrate-binding protein